MIENHGLKCLGNHVGVNIHNTEGNVEILNIIVEAMDCSF